MKKQTAANNEVLKSVKPMVNTKIYKEVLIIMNSTEDQVEAKRQAVEFLKQYSEDAFGLVEEFEEVVEPKKEAVEALTPYLLQKKEREFKKANAEVVQDYYVEKPIHTDWMAEQLEERIVETAAETGPLETDVENIKVLVTGAGIVESFGEGLLALEQFFESRADGFANVFVEIPTYKKEELEKVLPGWVRPSEAYLTRTFLFGMNLSRDDSSRWKRAKKLMQVAFDSKQKAI